MSTVSPGPQDRPDPFKNYQPGPPPARGKGRWWLYGCLGAFILMVLVCAGGVFWAVKAGPSWLARQAHAALVQSVNDSTLSAPDKQAMIVHLDRLHADYQAGRLSME